MSGKLDQVQNVDIDSGGRFKYILVKISDGSREKYIVRGYGRAGYHGMSVCASARLLNLLYFVYNCAQHQHVLPTCSSLPKYAQVKS